MSVSTHMQRRQKPCWSELQKTCSLQPFHFSSCTPNHHFSATQHHAGPCAISSIWISKAKKKNHKKHSLKCYTYFHCLPVWFISHTALEVSFKNVHQIFSFSVQNPSMVPIKLYGIVYNALKRWFSPWEGRQFWSPTSFLWVFFVCRYHHVAHLEDRVLLASSG